MNRQSTPESEKPPTDMNSFKQGLWKIIFEAETPAGKAFDLLLGISILASVIAVMLETVDSINQKYGALLVAVEWGFTVLFTIEYFLRIWLSRRPLRYAFSFFGIVDFISCIPTYLTLIPCFGASGGALRVVRVLRLLRMFRVLKMVQHVRGANMIMRGLRQSRAKITVFFTAVFLLTTLMGTLMYVVENGSNEQFSSIPTSIYYAIVSISTVGYGDITPVTELGKVITSVMILTGYAIIAVPTGIVTSAMVKVETDETTDACPGCGVHGHLIDADYCRKCGEKLDD